MSNPTTTTCAIALLPFIRRSSRCSPGGEPSTASRAEVNGARRAALRAQAWRGHPAHGCQHLLIDGSLPSSSLARPHQVAMTSTNVAPQHRELLFLVV